MSYVTDIWESKKQICKLLLLDLEDLGRQNCAPRMTDPAQNRLGARQQAAARWRNEDGWGVGKQNGHSQRSHKAAVTIFFLVRSNFEDSIAASWTKELRKHVPCLYCALIPIILHSFVHDCPCREFHSLNLNWGLIWNNKGPSEQSLNWVNNLNLLSSHSLSGW